MDNINRQDDHKKHKQLEKIFPELENILGKSEEIILDGFSIPKKKVYLIIGCARSGSTLLYQYLANTGYFVYPTNFLSRFYYAPYIGYRLQQALLDFDVKGEIFQQQESNKNFTSNLGKTKGPKEPHEFWYFWNRFFKFKELQQLSEDEINDVDWSLFLKELHALEEAANQPILMKAINLNWNLKDLKERIPNVHFVYIKRDVVYNAQSLLVSRNNFFGNYEEWYSFKTPNYHYLKKLAPAVQVVEQVITNNLDIEKQLLSIEEVNKTTITYSDFCNQPSSVIEDLNKKGADIVGYDSVFNFKNGNVENLTSSLFNEISAYLSKRN
ncbi:MAG: hypothetical protein ACI9YE_000156 [Psychroserpens sp.]|jgi:hypothetical protein